MKFKPYHDLHTLHKMSCNLKNLLCIHMLLILQVFILSIVCQLFYIASIDRHHGIQTECMYYTYCMLSMYVVKSSALYIQYVSIYIVILILLWLRIIKESGTSMQKFVLIINHYTCVNMIYGTKL